MGNSELQFGKSGTPLSVQPSIKQGFTQAETSDTYDVVTYDSYMQPNVAGLLNSKVWLILGHFIFSIYINIDLYNFTYHEYDYLALIIL